MALYLERNPGATPSQVRTALINGATSGVLDATTLNGTPNKLLYTNFVPYAAQNASGQELGVDYVSNGSFEAGTTGWTLSQNASIGTSTTDPPYAGSNRLRLGFSTTSLGSARTQLVNTMTAGDSPATYVVRMRLKVVTSSSPSYPCRAERLMVTLASTSTQSFIIDACGGLYQGASSDGYREIWFDTGLTQLSSTAASSLRIETTRSCGGITGCDSLNPPSQSYFLVDDVRVVRASATAPTAWSPLLNANFELGNNGNWTWTRDGGQSAFVAGGGGANGTWSARLGGWSDNAAHVDRLYQNLTIPVGTRAPRITIPITITTSETTVSAVDQLAIYAYDPAAGMGVLLGKGIASFGYQFNNRSASGSYTYSLDGFIGRTIQLMFIASSDANNLATTFKIDNITLTNSNTSTWTSPVLP